VPPLDLPVDVAVLLLRLGLMLVLYLFLLSVFLLTRGELRRQVQGAQGAAGRLILLEAGATGLPSGHALPLQPVTTIGRSPTSTVPLNDSFVSTTHAVLTWRGSQWWLRDAGSTNGTMLNQQPLAEGETPVQYGDVIGIGRIRLKLAP
jgi:hypothetical protein